MRKPLLLICGLAACFAVATYSYADVETLDAFMSPHQPVVDGVPMPSGADLFDDYQGYLYREDQGFLLIHAGGFKHEPDQLCERIQAAEVPGLKLKKVTIMGGITDVCNDRNVP